MPTRPSYYKPQHQAPRREDRGTAHSRGYDRAWKRLRDAHLTEHPFCFACPEFASLVDHIKPVVIEPTRRLDPTNLRSCCVDCHAAITTNFKLNGVNELPRVQKTHTPHADVCVL